jgi:hypothetical protein
MSALRIEAQYEAKGASLTLDNRITAVSVPPNGDSDFIFDRLGEAGLVPKH